jgi:hypothetical protein
MPHDVPKTVSRVLQVNADLDGLSGQFPGHLHEPWPWHGQLAVKHTLFSLGSIGLFVMARLAPGAFHAGTTSFLERSPEIPFHLSSTHLTIGQISLLWHQVFFVRLTRPQLHRSSVTLQIFERHGPEHKWLFGADSHAEIAWVVKQIHARVDAQRTTQLPTELSRLMERPSESSEA